MQLDTFALQYLLNSRGHILVLPLNHARTLFDNCDFASEAAEHLSEFQPHIATADNNQTFGNEINVHHGAVREIWDVLEPGDRRYERTSADIDKDLIGRDHFRSDADESRRLESRVAFVDDAVFHLLEPLLDRGPMRFGYRVLPCFDAPHVYANRAGDRDTEIGGLASHIGRM
jgi:hypothetical protein